MGLCLDMGNTLITRATRFVSGESLFYQLGKMLWSCESRCTCTLGHALGYGLVIWYILGYSLGYWFRFRYDYVLDHGFRYILGYGLLLEFRFRYGLQYVLAYGLAATA